MTHVGEHRIAAPGKRCFQQFIRAPYYNSRLEHTLGIACWNPAFDVTPANLITGIITEKGVFQTSELFDRVKEITGVNSATITTAPGDADTTK